MPKPNKFQLAASLVPISEALYDLCGVELDRRGRGPCPICRPSERSDCLALYAEKGTFYCFRCGEKGNVVTLVSKALDLRPGKAADLLVATYKLDDVEVDEAEFEAKVAELKAQRAEYANERFIVARNFRALADEADRMRSIIRRSVPYLRDPNNPKYAIAELTYASAHNTLQLLEFEMDLMLGTGNSVRGGTA